MIHQRPPQPDVEDEVDLALMAANLWKGKHWIALSTGLALAVGVLVAVLAAPTYKADALLQLEERSGILALPTEMSDLLSNDPRTITEIEILRSRFILGQVIAAEHLDWEITPRTAPLIGSVLMRFDLPVPQLGLLRQYARAGEMVGIDFLQVPPDWVEKPIALAVSGPQNATLRTPDGVTHDLQVGAMLRLEDHGFAIRIGAISAPPGRVYDITQRDVKRLIKELRDALSVSERGRQSGMLDIQFAATDPEQARRILAAVTEAYLRQNISRSAAEAESSLTFIENQLVEARASVDTAEANLNRYKQQQMSVDLSFETASLLEQISTLEADLRRLQNEEDKVRQLYTTNHPTYQQLLTQRARLEAKLADLRGEVAQLPATQRDILNLTRDFELTQEIYTQLLTRAQEVRVLKASTIGNVRIIDFAQTASRPVAPQKGLIIVLSGVLGLLAGLLFVLMNGWMRKGIQGAEDLEKLGISVFATLNYSADGDLQNARGGDTPLISLTTPTNITVEALRSLRTSLHFGMLDATTRSLAITSTAPGAGKSFTCANLAVVSAQAGQKVCLIDCDLRRGQLRKYFGVPKGNPGLSEILSGQCTLDEALIEGPVPGLYFLPAGRIPPNPSELLMRNSLPDLIADLDREFDLTLLDCPPVLAVTDPVIISRVAGATIAVIRYDVTPVGEITALMNTFKASSVRPIGAVLNGFDPKRAKAGYSYSYSYNTRYDYSKKS
ncbi:polysaccharide biosynthesis tyrosine autokinase [Phaeovulum sp.]|uniref:polysaccharide biosynthesis tyrosine autokinase n=1 Tax=Phaeovulum sp. TaxID=2934796 RepID=UPI0039E4B01F